MNYIPEQITAAQVANIQMLEDMATSMYAGFEQLAWLNLATSKAAFVEACRRAQTLLDAKDPQEWMALQMAMLQPPSADYANQIRRLLDVVFGVHSEFAKGMDSMLAAFNRTMHNGDSVIERARNSSKKAVKVIKVE